MKRSRTWGVVAGAICAVAVLAGCATYQAFRKCGLEGCPADAPVTAEVLALLARHPALAPPNEVYVQTVDGVVYLSGQVQTDLQREEAEAVAVAGAPGHRIVDSIALGYNGR